VYSYLSLSFSFFVSSSHSSLSGIHSYLYDDSADVPKIWDYWNSYTVPLIIIVILFPLINLKQFQILVKLNTVGVLSVAYLLVYIPAISFYNRTPDLQSVEEFDEKFFYLAAIMTLAFFIHNCVLSILKHNRYPEKNGRDLIVAYLIVAACYAIVGGSGYLAYGNGDIPQNFLIKQSNKDVFSMIARGFVVIQLISVYPLILMIIRLQFFGNFWGNQYPGFFHVLLLNIVLASITTVFAIFFPEIATVLRFTGALCGLIYVFILPIGVHFVTLHKVGKLTRLSVVLHSLLVVVGVATLVSQFF